MFQTLIFSPKYGLVCNIWQSSQGLRMVEAQQSNVLLRHILQNIQQRSELYRWKSLRGFFGHGDIVADDFKLTKDIFLHTEGSLCQTHFEF